MPPALQQSLRWISSAFLGLILIAALLLPGLRIAGYQLGVDRSQSMQPAIQKGDLLLIKDTHPESVNKGDIIVFQTPQRFVLVHRLIDTQPESGSWQMTTRGDDSGQTEKWGIENHGIIGRVEIIVPGIGGPLEFLTLPKNQRMVALGVGLGAIILILLRIFGMIRRKRVSA